MTRTQLTRFFEQHLACPRGRHYFQTIVPHTAKPLNLRKLWEACAVPNFLYWILTLTCTRDQLRQVLVTLRDWSETVERTPFDLTHDARVGIRLLDDVEEHTPQWLFVWALDSIDRPGRYTTAQHAIVKAFCDVLRQAVDDCGLWDIIVASLEQHVGNQHVGNQHVGNQHVGTQQVSEQQCTSPD